MRKKIISLILALVVAFSFVACNSKAKVKDESASHVEEVKKLSLWMDGNIVQEFEPEDGKLLMYKDASINIMIRVESATNEKIRLQSTNDILFEGSNKLCEIEDRGLCIIENQKNVFLTYGEVESIYEAAVERLDALMSNVNITKESYISFVNDVVGDSITDFDLTANISVWEADMHHVTNYNSTTIIYLHYPNSSVAEEMYGYYSGEMFASPGYYQYAFEGDGYKVTSSDDASVMFFIGNDQISVASYSDESANEVASQMNLPTPAEVRSLLILIYSLM